MRKTRWSAHLSAKRYVYFWVDGIYFWHPLLSTDHGTKELIAITDGYRESEQFLLDLKSPCGVSGIGPELVTGDAAIGFWRRSAKSTGPPASSAAGCIRRAIS